MLIGVAGVPTTLAAIHYGFTKDTFAAVDGQILQHNNITKLRAELAAATLEELVATSGKWAVLNEFRARIMLFGSIVLETFMEELEFTRSYALLRPACAMASLKS